VELKTTPNGVSVCSFSIATDTGYGENKKTIFVNVVAWRKTAEFISKYFTKGSMIAFKGSIQTRQYEDRDGNKRTAFEVVAEEVHFSESKKSESKPSADVNVDPNNDPLKNFIEDNDFDGDMPF
jgi:single-strand DNA-binding protein